MIQVSVKKTSNELYHNLFYYKSFRMFVSIFYIIGISCYVWFLCCL